MFYGEKQFLKLHVNYRYDARPVAPGSALRITVNGKLISEIPLLAGTGQVTHAREVLIPVSEIRSFGNTALFSFDFVPINRDINSATALSGEILCNSTLDLSGASLWTELPNLHLFAVAGFPFTQFADLSQTVVVLPSSPSPGEISLYLHLMSYFGAQTGYPALRVTVTGPGNVIARGHDYLILGTNKDQPAFESLASVFPANFDAAGVWVKPPDGLAARMASMQDAAVRRLPWLLGDESTGLGPPTDGSYADAIVQQARSPVSPDRSVITIALHQPSVANEFSEALLDPARSATMAGSLVLVRDSTFNSYDGITTSYHLGQISSFALMRFYATRYFLLLLVAVLALIFFSARVVYGWMARHASRRLGLAEGAEDSELKRQ